MPGGDSIEIPLLLLYFVARAFKDERQSDHLVGSKAFNFRNEKLFCLALQVGEGARGLGFQRQAKLKLEIIDEADAGRRLALSCQVIHELEAVFERRKENGAVFLYFRKREDLYDGGGNDSERSLGTQDQSPEIEADGFPRRSACSLQLA